MKRIAGMAASVLAVGSLIAQPAISASAATGAPTVHPESTLGVSPRVSCGGFNGNVDYDADASGGPALSIWGEVWSSCGDTSVWLSWNAPTHHNVEIDDAGSGTTVGVSVTSFLTTFGVSNIAVTVSTTGGGWHSGAPVYPKV